MQVTQNNLFYLHQKQWLTLPKWLDFFVELGSEVAQLKKEKNQIVIAVALPTRNYAAAFTALGIILTRTKLYSHQNKNDQYFEQLSQLPHGQGIFYFSKGKKYNAVLEGLDKFNNQQCLRVRVESKKTGGLTYLVPVKDVHQITVREMAVKNLPKRQNGRQVHSTSNFAIRLLGKKNADIHSKKSQLECLMFGKVNLLNIEIMETLLTCKDSGSDKIVQKPGTLQDILRVRRFFATGNQPYRSDIISNNSKKIPCILEQKTFLSLVAVFDGASGFLKWRDQCDSMHWVILLDKTETRFQETVENINQDYIMHRIADKKLKSSLLAPYGTEVFAYER